MKPEEKEVLSIKSIYCAEICAGVVSRQLKKALKAYKERVDKVIDEWISKCNLWTTKDIRGSSEVTTEEKWISMVQFNKLKQRLEKLE